MGYQGAFFEEGDVRGQGVGFAERRDVAEEGLAGDSGEGVFDFSLEVLVEVGDGVGVVVAFFGSRGILFDWTGGRVNLWRVFE